MERYSYEKVLKQKYLKKHFQSSAFDQTIVPLCALHFWVATSLKTKCCIFDNFSFLQLVDLINLPLSAVLRGNLGGTRLQTFDPF